MFNTIRIIKKAIQLSKEGREAEISKKKKSEIARLFNDLYTYRKEYVEGMDRLPGSAMCGINPRGGYAWMCPECNKIHHPTECSVFSGLQYPKCCNTFAGHRLSGIRTE